MANEKITVRFNQTGKQETITREQWDTIVANGFQTDFTVIENPQPPKDVQAAMQPKSS